MAQTREKYEESIQKKRQKVESQKVAAANRAKAVENAEPVMVDGVDIRYCLGCTAEKVNIKDLSCSAYSRAGQVRWMRLGWCPHGNSGPNPPEMSEQKAKVRAGQQKQAKKK